MYQNFGPALAFELRPDLDGQRLHVTPGDAGGATAFGITYATASGYCAAHRYPTLTLNAMQQWTATTPIVATLYRDWFWDAVKGDDLPPGADLAAFNIASGSGPQRAKIMLQELLGVTADGVLGPVTMAAAAGADPQALLSGLHDSYMAFLRGLYDFGEFGNGWTRRCNEWLALGQTWITGETT